MKTLDQHPLVEKLIELNISPKTVSVGDAEITFTMEVVARPGSKKESLAIDDSGGLRLHLRARPIEGKANKAIVKFLAKGLGISASSITLIRGEKSKNKTFQFRYLFTDHKDVDYYISKLKELMGPQCL